MSFTSSYDNYLKHLGIYAYDNKTLQELSALQPTPNELQEKLEQLRFFRSWLQYICRGLFL